ncbi:hypothetical protein P3X46_024701 [Hevea brasiliensis]|uniref:Disease resistance RPP13-like protein 1 n=1 Tax=Hevea brasiliensis TaxID=3981 RepID=A0ABQ9L6L1_HEVBR|nr:putative disease resistance RPP13-like protein 1 [Hevea brasiliensis]KAJ9159179.1 hypothetical protein P3X46_024701 [Hevea brasiliensis]
MEAIAVVGEAILSASLQGLFKKLTSNDLLKFAKEEQVFAELKKWERLLKKIHAVLEDAEEKQMTNGFVKIWLGDLRDLAYDMEDLLDEFTTEALQRKAMVKPHASTSKTRKFIPSCFTSLNPHIAIFKFRMESKIKEVTRRLKQLVSEKDDLELKEYGGAKSYERKERIPSTSVVNECHVYGREKDKEAILELLLRAEVSEDDLCVIPIIGMGGVGKTTLAQIAFNDEQVKKSFELKAWVCVSEEFDVVKITRAILQAITLESFDKEDLNLLQVRLKEKLSGKKFILVLDDVWNENYDLWDIVRRPFVTASPGSKIIVTTRNEGVASIMGNVPAYSLQVLEDDECLSLFLQHALGTRNFDSYPNLKLIGEEIVKRCKGLPLAAKAIGGLLRRKQNCDEWEDILNSRIWDLPEERSVIFPALRLSYHHLPSHLKRCFAYCAIFPKDYEFNENELVLLWMAEGFLQQIKGKKQMEVLGLEYFGDLLSRSFFQQSSSNSSRFVMHDLIHDLAQSIAEDVCFSLEDRLESDKFVMNFEKVRYASFNHHRYDISQRFEVFYKMKNLRTFLALPALLASDSDWCYLPYKVLQDLLTRLQCLRILSLSGYRIKEIPDSISNLKHLRHLNISHCAVQCLPESVSALSNLQTLILRRCSKLSKLPAGTGNLINLRHLDITCTHNLLEMPLGIGKLTDLQFLPKFIVGTCGGLKIKELKDLLQLQKGLSITGLHHVVDVRDARVANLKQKQGLDELAFEWIDDFYDSRSKRNEMQVLNFLEPHQNLKRLTIKFYCGTEFPSWLGDSSFSNLTHLELCDCRKSTSLPSLGQLPSLQDLSIRGMNAVKYVGIEFYGDLSPSFVYFPSLKILKFEDMQEWHEWSFHGVTEEGIYPNLLELTIKNCPKLNGNLPSHFLSLYSLHIFKCPSLTGPLISLPSLRELNIRECNEVVPKILTDLTSLTTLRIGRISRFTSLPNVLIQSLESLEILEIQDCHEMISLWQERASVERLASLRRLEIHNCSQLVSLENEESLPCSLEVVNLVNGGALEKLPNGLHMLTCLRSLSIRRCARLISVAETCLPSSLKHLQLINCDTLMSLPLGVTVLMHANKSNQCLLEELEIQSCPSLKSFPKGKLPSTLKSLAIRDCRNLLSLPEGIMCIDNDVNPMPLLEELTVSGCSSLTTFPAGVFPSRLKTFHVWDFNQLESLSRWMFRSNMLLECISIWNCPILKILELEYHASLMHLSELEISCCPSLKSLGSSFSIPNLKSLKIEDCLTLKSLPNQMHNLKSLESLIILDCPSLTSFPDGGLPHNLTKLEIWNCENLKQPMSDWGMHRLTSLQCFHLVGTSPPEMSSFPDEGGLLLPTSLNFLFLERVQNLESLSRGIQELTSLVQLWIINCPNVWSLPKEGLPPTLGQLYIGNCPLLKRRCSKEKGEYWPIIAHIPHMVID